MFRHAWLALLFFFASLPALGAPSVTFGPGAKSGQATVIIATDDTSDSRAIPVDGICSARVIIAGSDVVELWGVNSPATAATSGTQIGSDFTTSTPPTAPFTWTAGTTHVKVKGTTATTGGSVVIIDCNPLQSAGGGSGGSFDTCRSGSVQGGGYSSTDGRWAWTCGNYNWRGYQDSANAGAAYTVTCTGDGTPHTSCFRSGETRHIGYGLNISLAAQYARDGGRVYLPRGVYVDNGAGDDASGNPTAFPHPYDPEWEARSDFASLGYTTALRVIQLDRGVRLIGEGIPTAETVDPGDDTVTTHTPRISGTWILDDRGAGSGNSSVSHTEGGIGENIDVPEFYRMVVGGNQVPDFCLSTSTSDPRCVTNSSAGAYEDAQDFANGANVWGVRFSMLENYVGSTGRICVPDTDTSLGSSEADAIGTCSLNRKIRCWDDTTASEPRSSGGCDFGAGGDFGACQAPYEALVQDYVTDAQDLQLALHLTECTDNATSNADCATPLGQEVYIVDIQDAPGSALLGTSCAAGAGSYVEVGNAWTTSANDTSPSIPFPTFYIGGTSAVNFVFPIKRGGMDGKGAGFENIGRMPANWLTRDSATAAADCLSGGDSSHTNDEVGCDTDTLSAFSMRHNNLIGPNNLFFKASQYIGKSAVVENYPAGGLNSFIGNTIDTHYRHTVTDWQNGLFAYNTIRNLNAGPYPTRNPFAACFSGVCRFHYNRIINSPVSYMFTSNRAAQLMEIIGTEYENVSHTNYLHIINGGKNYIVRDEIVNGTYYQPYAFISPGTNSIQKPTVEFTGIRLFSENLGVASNATTGGGSPVAFFLFESDDTADSRADDWKSVLIDNVTAQSTASEACLAWFEDDLRGTSGAAADTAALTREAASRVTIRNSNIISTSGAIACTSAYEYQASVHDASDSDSWAVEAYAPTLIGNFVNNIPQPNMANTVSEATLGLASAYPNGTVVRLHDGAAACAHTSGNLDSGAAVVTCVNDQAANTWAEWP